MNAPDCTSLSQDTYFTQTDEGFSQPSTVWMEVDGAQKCYEAKSTYDQTANKAKNPF